MRRGRREGKDMRSSERNRPHNREMGKRHEGIREAKTTKSIVVENNNPQLLIKIPLSWVTANEQNLITLTISHRARHQSACVPRYITILLSLPFLSY